MGTWGPGIFQNDVADDLKRVYIEKLKLGKSDDEALSETISYLADYAEDEEDSIDFWLGLASVMFDYGRLTDPIKKKALQIIDSSVDLERWDECDKKRRQVIIVELKDKLNSEQPERKKVSVAKRKIPEIKPNDIWCFKLKGDNPYYVLILVDSWIKYDLRVDNLGDQCPIIYIKISDHIPDDIEEVDNMPFFCSDSYLWRNIDKCEKRVVMNHRGFNKIKSRLSFIGNFSFHRPKESDLYEISELSVRYHETPSLPWDVFEDNILSVFFCVPKSKDWVSKR